MEPLSRVTLDQLRTLRVLAKVKSFTLAAEELCLSQPAVSVQIRALEKECGAALFDRLGKRVILTQVGETMLSCAEDVLGRLEEAQQELDNLNGLQRGKLSLAASQAAGTYALPEILRSFSEKYPGVKINLRIGFGEDVTAQVLNGSVDLGVLGERDSIKDDRLQIRPFVVDDLVVVINTRHEWAGRESVSVEELQGQPFIISRESSAIWEMLQNRLRAAEISLDSNLQLGSYDGVKRAVEIGLGISVMLSMGITQRDLEPGRLKVLKLEGVPAKFNLCLIWLKDRRLPKVVDAFLSLVGEEAPRLGSRAVSG